MPYYKADREIMTNPNEIADKKVIVVAESVIDHSSWVETLLDGTVITEEESEVIFLNPLEGSEKHLYYLLCFDNQQDKTITRLYKVVA